MNFYYPNPDGPANHTGSNIRVVNYNTIKTKTTGAIRRELDRLMEGRVIICLLVLTQSDRRIAEIREMFASLTRMLI
jgi:hypothetical protein